MKELSKQLRCEAPTQYIDVSENNSSQYSIRWNLKGLLPSKYNRTIGKRRIIRKYFTETLQLADIDGSSTKKP